MKVLIYAHAFAPSVGGVETHAMLLARGLVGAMDGNGPRLAGAASSVTVVTATAAAGFDDAALPFRVVRRPGLLQLWRLVREADIVQLAGPVFVPLAIGLLMRKRIVLEHHGYQAICPNGMLFYEPTKAACPGHYMAGRYLSCLRCNAVTDGWMGSVRLLLLTFPRRQLSKLVPVNVTRTHHVRGRLGLPRAQVIYHGIPRPSASPGGVADPGAAGDAPLCFAYVGRLVSEKGLRLLLRAASRIKGEGYAFRLLFIGDGPERAELEGLAAELGLGPVTSFVGLLRGPALEATVADVAAVIMPSLMEETAGLAAIEQMMRGRLVIAADIGGLGEVVGEAGLKFPVADEDGLVRCLRQVLDAPGLVRELGEKARRKSEELFVQERMVARHVDVYRALKQGAEP
jgi:glycosyltransferase involved in cell wall biosynthesis